MQEDGAEGLVMKVDYEWRDYVGKLRGRTVGTGNT